MVNEMEGIKKEDIGALCEVTYIPCIFVDRGKPRRNLQG
jgi:hypothetical protein